jgi:hypothetical protein
MVFSLRSSARPAKAADFGTGLPTIFSWMARHVSGPGLPSTETPSAAWTLRTTALMFMHDLLGREGRA